MVLEIIDKNFYTLNLLSIYTNTQNLMIKKQKYKEGDVFGNFTLIKYSHQNDHYEKYWICKCKFCQKEKPLRLRRVVSLKQKSCGCLKKTEKVKPGKKFGNFTVIKFSEKRNGKNYWICKCVCGNESSRSASSIRNNRYKSCGCLNNEHITNETVRLVEAKRIFSNRYNDGDLSFEDFLELSQKNCHYCGREPSSKSHVVYTSSGSLRHKKTQKNNIYLNFPDAYFVYNGLDRISSDGLHTKDNVVPCCGVCNQTKRHLPYTEFLNLIKKIYKNLNLDEESKGGDEVETLSYDRLQ